MTPSTGRIQLTALDPAGYRHMPWKNGGGVTIDIAASMLPGFEPGSWEGIIWRFSRTAIVTPGAFSDLSGYDRQLVLVSGEGLETSPTPPARQTSRRAGWTDLV